MTDRGHYESSRQVAPSLNRIMAGEAYLDDFKDLAAKLKNRRRRKHLIQIITGGITERKSFKELRQTIRAKFDKTLKHRDSSDFQGT